jgi:hypothetical protein
MPAGHPDFSIVKDGLTNAQQKTARSEHHGPLRDFWAQQKRNVARVNHRPQHLASVLLLSPGVSLRHGRAATQGVASGPAPIVKSYRREVEARVAIVRWL